MSCVTDMRIHCRLQSEKFKGKKINPGFSTQTSNTRCAKNSNPQERTQTSEKNRVFVSPEVKKRKDTRNLSSPQGPHNRNTTARSHYDRTINKTLSVPFHFREIPFANDDSIRRRRRRRTELWMLWCAVVFLFLTLHSTLGRRYNKVRVN